MGRECHVDFAPDESAIKTDEVKIDKEMSDMLAALGMSNIFGLVEVETHSMIASPVFCQE